MIPLEPSGDLRRSAALIRQIFVALRQVGFDEHQALTLTDSWIRHLRGEAS